MTTISETETIACERCGEATDENENCPICDMPGLGTVSTRSPAVDWWSTEPPAVRAVLDLANLDDNERIVATFAPGMDDTIAGISDLLVEIDRLATGDTDLLAAYYDGARIAVEHEDDLADELIARLKGEVLASAQLCASVLTTRARKLRAA